MDPVAGLVDTGLLSFTTNHLVRYDQILSFAPYKDGLGIMRDAQTAPWARPAPCLPDRRRLVPLQPGHQLGPYAGIEPEHTGNAQDALHLWQKRAKDRPRVIS